MSDEFDEGKDLSVEEIEEEDNQYIDEMLDQLNEEDQKMDVDDGQIEAEHIEEERKYIISLLAYNKEFENFKAKGEIYSIALSNTGTLAIGDGEETTYFYDVVKKELVKQEILNTDSICHAKVSPDGKYIVTAGLDGKVNIFETVEYKLVDSLTGICNDINVLILLPYSGLNGIRKAMSSRLVQKTLRCLYTKQVI
jgi:WD40 repeat protein